MFKYRNLMTGRVLERPAFDKWLDASQGWELVEDDATITENDDERTDDNGGD